MVRQTAGCVLSGLFLLIMALFVFFLIKAGIEDLSDPTCGGQGQHTCAYDTANPTWADDLTKELTGDYYAW